jgi:hypothetical protein
MRRFSKATKPRRAPMTTNRLQLTLISDLRLCAQPLPSNVRKEGVELIAMMLLRLSRAVVWSDEDVVRDESR